MANSPKRADPIDELAALLRRQRPEVMAELVRGVKRRLEERERGPGLAGLTSLIVSVTGRGRLELTDTAGVVRTLSNGDEVALTPVTLPAAPADQGVPGFLATQPAPSALLLLALRGVGGAVTVRLDPTGLYRSWAQWGPLRLVVRTRGAGKAGLAVVGGAGVTLALGANEVVDVVGVGHAPRIDIAGLFGAVTAADDPDTRR